MTDTAITEGATGPADLLSRAETADAIKALDADEKLKLHAIAQGRARGTGMVGKDLLHETICRAMLGARRCPKNVPLMAFLVQTMRSISSHARDKYKAQRDREHADTGIDPVLLAEEKSRAPLSPEDQAMRDDEDDARTKMVEEIFECFKDDPEAELLLLGWSDGLRGEKLREFVGVDQPALDYVAKRIRRRVKQIYPKGSQS